MNKSIGIKTAIIMSLSSMTIGCSASNPVTIDVANSAIKSTSVTYFSTVNSEKSTAKFTKFLEGTKNPKRFQLECDQKNIAQSCYYYASYSDLIEEDYKQAYSYYTRAFDLGTKQTGYSISELQINYPELFTDDNRLNIDEIIDYLKQASEAGSPDATRLLMLIYRDPEFNRVDYDKSKYYNEVAIKQNVKYSRFTLAFLYTHHIKDKSKINQSIELYKDDLIREQNWESASALYAIYLNPERFGANKDYVKALAYIYISEHLHEGNVDSSISDVEKDTLEIMSEILTSKQLQQAKAMYLELMAKMNKEHASQ